MEIALALIVGIAIGAAGTWLLIRSRSRMDQEARQGIRDAVEATAAQALNANSQAFMSLAEQRLNTSLEAARGELNQRHDQFQALIRPLTEDYRNLNPQIQQLVRQNTELTAETSRLAGALTDNRAVGNWGEVQLRRVVELAGMTSYCDFAEQEQISSGERPDLLVKLPEDRTIIVDAKASTAAYLEAQQHEDPEQMAEVLKKHAQALRSQVDELAKKDYGSKEQNSLDFVVMFIPGDQFLAAALSQQPYLIEYAMERRVAVSTPSSLISLLWAVSNGWQQHRIARDAREIQAAGEEMHKRLLTFVNHYQNVGKELDSAMKAYNRSIGSFDSQLVPQGRRFAGLVRGDEEQMPEPPALETAARESRYVQAADN